MAKSAFKRCNKCQGMFDINNFNMKDSKTGRRDSYCKQCRSELNRIKRAKKKEQKKQEEENNRLKRVEFRNKIREVKKTYGSIEEYLREKREEIEKHQCHECVWGRFINTAKKYVCMFPNCQNGEQLQKVQ